MALRLTQADEHPVADDEAGGRVGVRVLRGDVGFPVRQILPVEQAEDLVRRDGLIALRDNGWRAGRCERGNQRERMRMRMRRRLAHPLRLVGLRAKGQKADGKLGS